MKIMVAIDRSEYGEIVAEHALDQAVQRRADELHFVAVVNAEDAGPSAHAFLAELASDLIATFGYESHKVRLHVRTGAPATAIAQLAHELAPDLLVIGRFSVPSNSDLILEQVECPTLVVGIDGPEAEPQCPACMEARRDSEAERLFCDQHDGERIPSLVTRVPHVGNVSSRLW